MGAVIRCDPIDGVLQVLGQGRYRGVVPEGITATSSHWGPDQLSFSLKVVDNSSIRPDLLPYSPIELEVDGSLVWAGRIKSRPSTEQDHAVECEGWHYHLDDDAFERVWVHTRESDYTDVRQHLSAQLAANEYNQAGNVSAGDLGIQIGWGDDTDLSQNARCGVLLDLGPEGASRAKRVVVSWESSNNDGTNSQLYCRGQNSGPFGSGDGLVSEDAFSINNNAGASGTNAGTFATARRYVVLFAYSPAATRTLTADVWFRITNVQVFSATAYESGNISILKADTVVKEARAFATLLNQEDRHISAGTFNVPEARTNGYQSPKEVIEWINAYENYQAKIGGEGLKSLVYRAKPTIPFYEVGNWSGAQFADASVNGEDIYSDAIVTGTGPDGTPLVENVTQPVATLVSKNGGQRTRVLPIRTAGTTSVFQQFGNLYLLEHRTASFSGKLSIRGAALRRYLGGMPVPPHMLLRAVGERINFAHRRDPDTGAWGRLGTIAAVRYSHDDRSLEIDIDDRRDHFETILGRYGILVDQFT